MLSITSNYPWMIVSIIACFLIILALVFKLYFNLKNKSEEYNELDKKQEQVVSDFIKGEKKKSKKLSEKEIEQIISGNKSQKEKEDQEHVKEKE